MDEGEAKDRATGVVKLFPHPRWRVSGWVPVRQTGVYRPGKDPQQAPGDGVAAPRPTTRENTQAQGGNRQL